MTRKQLLRFCKMRNKSSFATNLQFDIDARDCGFSAKELGEPINCGDYHWEWQTPHGKLIERGGELRLLERVDA